MERRKQKWKKDWIWCRSLESINSDLQCRREGFTLVFFFIFRPFILLRGFERLMCIFWRNLENCSFYSWKLFSLTSKVPPNCSKSLDYNFKSDTSRQSSKFNFVVYRSWGTYSKENSIRMATQNTITDNSHFFQLKPFRNSISDTLLYFVNKEKWYTKILITISINALLCQMRKMRNQEKAIKRQWFHVDHK